MTTKVIKKLKIAAATVFVLGLAINVYMTLNQPFSTVDTMLIAQQTWMKGDGQFTSNFKSAIIYYNADIEVGGEIKYSEPGWWASGTWKSLRCCIMGTDMDGCNFNLEDTKCKNRVARPAH